jgi:hypothetical protein
MKIKIYSLTPEEWAESMMGLSKKLVSTDIGGIHISTVFLGLNHNYHDDGPPILWETMVFGGVHDQYMERYDCKIAAITGHQRIVKLVEDSI